jgi:N-hydroxyarylamine O-acetyltransferase
MEVGKYFKRIGFARDLTNSERDRQLLDQIVQSHAYNVPFENLDIHRGKKISIDLRDIYDKVVGNTIIKSS